MKSLSKKEQMKVNGGAALHYHWYCSINSFISNKHDTLDVAAAYAGRHVGRYPTHTLFSITTYGSCTSSW